MAELSECEGDENENENENENSRNEDANNNPCGDALPTGYFPNQYSYL